MLGLCSTKPQSMARSVQSTFFQSLHYQVEESKMKEFIQQSLILYFSGVNSAEAMCRP
jgi:hypothetical protein